MKNSACTFCFAVAVDDDDDDDDGGGGGGLVRPSKRERKFLLQLPALGQQGVPRIYLKQHVPSLAPRYIIYYSTPAARK